MRISLNDFPWRHVTVPQASLVDIAPATIDAPDVVLVSSATPEIPQPPILRITTILPPAAFEAEPAQETQMNWLKLFSLIPYIAAGVQVVHADLDGPGKVQAAQDALAIATAAAGTVLSTEDNIKATAISSLASTTLAGLVTALHG